MLHGLTAAFRELQFTIKAGENKPWADKRVRQAVNFAINRQNLIDKVYDGYGQYSRPRRGRLRPVADPAGRAEGEVREVRPAEGEEADGGGRRSKGFDVTMTTFSTPLDYPAMAALIKNDLRRSASTSTSSRRTRSTFGAKNGAGAFDWDLTGRGMRGDVDGYVAEFNPTGASADRLQDVVHAATSSNPKPMWRLVGNGRITLDTKKRLPMYQKLDQAADGRAARGRRSSRSRSSRS